MKIVRNNVLFSDSILIGNLITTIKNKKRFNIPSSEILKTGKYPVISQDKKFISGYSDDSDFVLNASERNPYLVFGDHTCVIKNIKFPFIIGADGTQVFSTNEKIVLNDFLYYFVLSGRAIQQGGYKRHFTELKDKMISYPSLEEQKVIVELLNKEAIKLKKIQALISKIKKRNQYYLNKVLETISDVENSKDKHSLADFVSFIKGNSFKKADMDNIGDYPIIKMNNFKDGRVVINDKTLYTDIVAKKSKLEKGDVLIGMSGSVGSSAVFELDTKSYLNQRIIALRLMDNKFKNIIQNIMPHYIKNLIQKQINGGAIKNVSYKHIEGLAFYTDIEELCRKADELNKLENELESLKKLYSKEKQVFQWLCEKLVSGEYRINE